jgi:hypothetical protein
MCRCARKIPKLVLETTLIIKETTYTLDFGKYFYVSFWSHSIRTFSVFLEDSLRIFSETWYAVTKPSRKLELAAEKLWKKLSLACEKNSVG